MPTYYIDCAGQGRGRESVRVKGQILLARINSCISNRMYVRVTVGRRDPAVELTWKYLQRVTSTYMRLLSGQLIIEEELPQLVEKSYNHIEHREFKNNLRGNQAAV